MLGFRFVSLSEVLHPVMNSSGLSRHKYQVSDGGLESPQAAMKTPMAFMGTVSCRTQRLGAPELTWLLAK